MDGGQKVPIRLACIDAPEMAQVPYLAPGSTQSPELSGEGGVSSLIGPRTTP
jgi:endonuclease YncB( thermonuclease family)